jgi:hypothetical protein
VLRKHAHFGVGEHDPLPYRAAVLKQGDLRSKGSRVPKRVCQYYSGTQYVGRLSGGTLAILTGGMVWNIAYVSATARWRNWDMKDRAEQLSTSLIYSAFLC